MTSSGRFRVTSAIEGLRGTGGQEQACRHRGNRIAAMVRLSACGTHRSCLPVELARTPVREVPICSAYARASVAYVPRGRKERLS